MQVAASYRGSPETYIHRWVGWLVPYILRARRLNFLLLESWAARAAFEGNTVN